MVAALYSSRENGQNTSYLKTVYLDGSQLRTEISEPLNVKAGKIMQRPDVLAEMKELLSTDTNDSHFSNTIQYLEACNKLFENGFLSHYKNNISRQKCHRVFGKRIFCWVV